MAGPFSNAGLGQFGGDSKYIPSAGEGGGLGTVAAAYLAHKAGLIDLNNKEQAGSIQKNGLFGHVAMNALNGAVKPPAKTLAPVVPNSAVTVGGPMNQSMPQGVPIAPLDSGVDIGGPMNQQLPQGTPLGPIEPDVFTPRQNTGTAMSDVDPELIDSSLSNFAALFA